MSFCSTGGGFAPDPELIEPTNKPDRRDFIVEKVPAARLHGAGRNGGCTAQPLKPD
ncbi:hypothetical protein [Polaromonas sp. CG9_12]|nr:hypothetical protein [Polaromonas sp. CG9_12]